MEIISQRIKSLFILIGYQLGVRLLATSLEQLVKGLLSLLKIQKKYIKKKHRKLQENPLVRRIKGGGVILKKKLGT